jgi:hypothetical protein
MATPIEQQGGWYQSRQGAVLCHQHALKLTIQEIADGGWVPMPEPPTLPTCQRCARDGRPTPSHQSA